MTISKSAEQIPSKLPPVPDVAQMQVDQDATQVAQVPTAGSPTQGSAKPSWFSTHTKLVGALVGAAVGGGIGFLTLGIPGAIGGAAIGALAGSFLIGKFYHPKTAATVTTVTTQTQPPLPPGR